MKRHTRLLLLIFTGILCLGGCKEASQTEEPVKKNELSSEIDLPEKEIVSKVEAEKKEEPEKEEPKKEEPKEEEPQKKEEPQEKAEKEKPKQTEQEETPKKDTGKKKEESKEKEDGEKAEKPKTENKKEEKYNPKDVVRLATAKTQKEGKILLTDNLDRLLEEGQITKEEYDEYYPYDGAGYYSVFVETDLNEARTISGERLESVDAIATHIAEMLVLEKGPYFLIEYAGITKVSGTAFYEFRCYRA